MTPMILVLLAILVVAVVAWMVINHRAIRYQNLRRLVVLRKLDSALWDVYYGRNPPRTFEGWFLDKVAMARKLGAREKEVNLRLNHVLSLAEKGIFFSPRVKEIHEQGPDALSGHIEYLKIVTGGRRR